MSGFLNDLKKNAEKISKTIVDKTAKTVDYTKKELEIQRLNLDISKLYKQLGKLYYNQEVDHIVNLDTEMDAICEKISIKKAQLKKVKESTPGQDEDISEEVLVEEDDIEVEEHKKPERNEDGYFVMKFCKHCQTGNHTEAVTCVNCGRKF